MRKNILILSLLLISCVALATYNEVFLGFDGGVSEDKISNYWVQNKNDNFKPLGKIEVIDEPFDNFEKALKLVSSTAMTEVLSDKISVVKGDAFIVTVIAKGEGGNSEAIIGMYEYGKNDLKQLETANVLVDGWTKKQYIFTVEDDIKYISFSLAALANKTIIYSNLSYRKLSKKEIQLYSPKENLNMWKNRVKGKNLALNKKVTFTPKPTYELTAKNSSDNKDLVDGKLLSNSSTLWFNSDAVAWFRAYNGVTIVVDLGSVMALKKAVIRINGGNILGGIMFPNELCSYVSKDGKNFYKTQSLRKVLATENYLSDWQELYYLPEITDKKSSGITYVYPFELNLNADARYVAIRAPHYTPVMMISDELAVIEATKEEEKQVAFNIAYNQAPELLNHESVIISPRMEKFYISEDIDTPNFLLIDSRLKNNNIKFSYSIDLPEGISFFDDKAWPTFTKTYQGKKTTNGRTTFNFNVSNNYNSFLDAAKKYFIGPFFFTKDSKVKVAKEQKYVIFTTYVNGKKEMFKKLPLEFVIMPKIAEFKRLQNGIGWMYNHHVATYPNFYENFKKMGFNVVSYFPLSNNASQYRKILDNAKKNGFKIRLQLSPSAIMNVYNKGITEFKCTSTPKGHSSACLAYRGKYYKKLLESIKNTIRDYPVDFVSFDEESWETSHLQLAMQCKRCNKLRESKNMNWIEYLNWAQADYLKPYYNAVSKGANEGNKSVPTIGFYALRKDFQYIKDVDFIGFRHLYPKYSDELQDSYYGRSVKDVHNRTRESYNVCKNPSKNIPWRTGGAGAYNEKAIPKSSLHHQLETFMNGAGGIQYYAYFSFESPLDYYYLALGMSQIAPYEDIIIDGVLDENFSGTNKNLLYTSRTLGDKSLILIGNYGSLIPQETVINLNGNVTNVVNGKNIPVKNNKLKLKINADDYALILVQQKRKD